MTNLKEQFYQTKNIEFLKKTLGRELWVQVSGSKDINGASAAFWAALMPVENIDEAYRDYSWNSYIGTQCPGFIEYGDKITYEANPLNFDSCLNIVQYREFYGIKPNYVEISEEFRLLNNLYHDINTNIFYEIEENGECTEVAKIINNDCAYIKLKSLMKFAAAKQMALLLFFDIRVKISGSLQKNGLKEFSTTVNEDGLFFGLWGGEQRLLETYSYSILMGKRILLPKPVEECGYKPYSRNEENEYPEYIIGIDEYGEPRSYTSNPAKLTNYFGANPGAPHYLTPVFFKKEVLQRYLSRPNIFSVEAGYLRCQSLWGIEIDNEHKDMVSVYLGDLGRDLPVQEHSHWKQYNIATDARLSTNAVKRDFLCAFTQPEISDLKFKSNFKQFVNTWREQYQWDLFLPLARAHSEDAPGYVIQSWLRNGNTLAFLNLWEQENNPNYSEVGYAELSKRKKNASFTLTPKLWIDQTKAIGIVSKQGKNGGTFAHPIIACEFASWIAPKFKMQLLRLSLDKTKLR